MTTITRIEYIYVEAREPDAKIGAVGWVNGTVHLSDGRVVVAGGGWLNDDGTVTPYSYSETGDADLLVEALDLDIDDVMALLSRDCPRTHDLPPNQERLDTGQSARHA